MDSLIVWFLGVRGRLIEYRSLAWLRLLGGTHGLSCARLRALGHGEVLLGLVLPACLLDCLALGIVLAVVELGQISLARLTLGISSTFGDVLGGLHQRQLGIL